MPNPTNSIAQNITLDQSETSKDQLIEAVTGGLTGDQKSTIRNNIGQSPEQTFSVWGASDISEIGNYAVGIGYDDVHDVVVMVDNTGAIYTGAPNEAGGVDWADTGEVSGFSGSSRVTCGGGVIVIWRSSSYTTKVSSDGGITFTDVDLPSTSIDLQVMEYGNGLFVAGGDDSDYYTSTNGSTWISQGVIGTGTLRFTDIYYSENISKWIATAWVSSTLAYAAFAISDPTVGGSWPVLWGSSTQGQYRVRGIYDYKGGVAMYGTQDSTVQVYDGTTVSHENASGVLWEDALGSSSNTIKPIRGNGLALHSLSDYLAYTKNDSSIAPISIKSPAGGATVRAITCGCYAGGSFKQFIIGATSYGGIYHSLRG